MDIDRRDETERARASDDDAKARSVRRVAEAIAAIPSALEEALAIPLPAPPDHAATIVTTGIGGSEGPARVLAHHLASDGRSARFASVSEFAVAPPHSDLLVVFSQGLSPNACLALDVAPARTTWLVTSVGHGPTTEDRTRRLAALERGGVVPIVTPPGDERGMLVRWIGPTVAALSALRIAGHLGVSRCAPTHLEEAPRRYRPNAGTRWPEGARLVVAGVHPDEAHAHRWKVLEALLDGDPPVWDVLQAAHGPLQSLAENLAPIVTLERPIAGALVERLQRSLPPDQPLARLVSTSDDALAIIEHAAMIDASMLATFEARPRNLFDWPGRGRDEPLYGLGR